MSTSFSNTQEKNSPPDKLSEKEIVVAVAGNPNAGKTTLFNSLTGTRQRVANYPGVTVEKKEGFLQREGRRFRLVDLPGTYSLSAYSLEEIVTRNYIVEEKPDVVINVVDSSNLERQLFLTVQLMELEIPLILVLNMWDVAEKEGVEIDHKLLEELMGVSNVFTVGTTGRGNEELMQKIIEISQGHHSKNSMDLKFNHDIEKAITSIQSEVEKEKLELLKKYDSRWLALKLLEDDGEIKQQCSTEAITRVVKESSEVLRNHLGLEPSIQVAEARYALISGICKEAVVTLVQKRSSVSDKIDRVLLLPYVGHFIFLAMMYLVFQLTFTLGDIPMGWIEDGFSWLGTQVSSLWPEGSDSDLRSLLVDGVIGGVGGVLVFLPNILLLFFCIAILEGSGYMARAAFLMDRLMHKIGLHGKSFIPMLIGFGCSIPAIMATRMLDSRRDRLLTMLVTPLMSCSARFPIYTLIIPAFFEGAALQSAVMFSMYLIGIVLAVICVKLLNVSLIKGESEPMVMELPLYHMPTMNSVMIHMWERSRVYLKKAGTVILSISIILWVLSTYPKYTPPEGHSMSAEELSTKSLAHSIVGRIGRVAEPLVKPMGFDWKIATSLIGALAAKEVFVAQLGVVYSVGDVDEESVPLRKKLSERYSPLQGFCILLFCLVSAPCMATVAIVRRESGSWNWALLMFFGLTALAYILTTVTYQVGTLFGLG